MRPGEINWTEVSSIIDKHTGEQWGLIPLLQDIQEAVGYIPPESIEEISEALHLFPSQVQGVVTFYAGFSLTPRGKHVVRVCRGTACHVKGGRSILRLMKKELGLEEGETGPDYRFTLETAACLGACFLAPAMMIDRTYYGRLTPGQVGTVLAQFRKQERE